MFGKAQRNFLVVVFLLACVYFVSDSVLAQGPDAARPGSAGPRGPATLPAASGFAARLPGGLWVPPDIDSGAPDVKSGQTCSLPAVLDGAGKRIRELVTNLDRFTATEFVEHQS